MILHCLRHGLTLGNRQGIFQGWSDGTLTPEQVSSLEAVRFDASTHDAVYCSPLGRCRQTARSLGIVDPILDPRIRERNLGVFEGLSFAECQGRFPEDLASFLRFDATYTIPGGESRAEHLARIEEWLGEIAQHRRVLAITHGGVIDFLYRMGTGSDLHGGSTIFAASNASLTSFDVAAAQVRLLAYDVPLIAKQV